MKSRTNRTGLDDPDDRQLVAASLGGDRQAFGKIVMRYQRLLCSLAYASVGSVSESEDVAQETFVEAWRKLPTLSDPEKLKSWLCGILRFKISHHRRRLNRQPVSNASELHPEAFESSDEPIENSTMKQEERALLWQALESVPETYRETLVLYYREHKSLEHVAHALDLSEDAVKQRLSRGRKMLQERVMGLVEGVLASSAPTQVFTAGVLAAVAAYPTPVKAAGVGVAAAKMGSAFKWASIAAFVASFSGLISSIFALRATLDQSRTKRERRAVVRTTSAFVGVAIAFPLVLLGLHYLAMSIHASALYMAVLSQLIVVSFGLGYLVLTRRLLSGLQQLRGAERLRRPDLFTSPDDQPGSAKGEYKSRLTLWGIPFVHAKFAMAEVGEKPAIGWIAMGSKAYGVLFAWGGYAVAPVSIGIVSFGLFTVGAVGFGVLGIGCLGVGLLAIGAASVGIKAYASLSALGWESAFSQCFAIAREAAIGSVAYAQHVNDEVAVAVSNISSADQSFAIILSVMSILVIVPVIIYARIVRKRMRRPIED